METYRISRLLTARSLMFVLSYHCEVLLQTVKTGMQSQAWCVHVPAWFRTLDRKLFNHIINQSADLNGPGLCKLRKGLNKLGRNRAHPCTGQLQWLLSSIVSTYKWGWSKGFNRWQQPSVLCQERVLLAPYPGTTYILAIAYTDTCSWKATTCGC